MLYTAQAWLDKQPEAGQAAAAARLAPCVCCMAGSAAGGVMQTYLPHIKQYFGLVLLGIITPEGVSC